VSVGESKNTAKWWKGGDASEAREWSGRVGNEGSRDRRAHLSRMRSHLHQSGCAWSASPACARRRWAVSAGEEESLSSASVETRRCEDTHERGIAAQVALSRYDDRDALEAVGRDRDSRGDRP